MRCDEPIELHRDCVEKAMSFSRELQRRKDQTLKVHEVAACDGCVPIIRDELDREARKRWVRDDNLWADIQRAMRKPATAFEWDDLINSLPNTFAFWHLVGDARRTWEKNRCKKQTGRAESYD
jgi:hypothetical protein